MARIAQSWSQPKPVGGGRLRAAHSVRRAMKTRMVADLQARSARVPGPVEEPLTRPLPNLGSIKGVLFDIDGTLSNTDPMHFRVFREMLQEHGFNDGVPIDEPFFRANIAGRHNSVIMADCFPAWTEAECVRFSEEKEEKFRALAGESLKRMPGLTDFLAWMDQNDMGRAAVTNAPRLNAECMLQGMDLAAEFSTLIIGEECDRAKPFPDPYLEGLEVLGIEPHEAIAFEDSPSGMRAAVAAGIPTIGILSGQSADVLREAGASYLVRDFFDVMALCEEQEQPQQVPLAEAAVAA